MTIGNETPVINRHQSKKKKKEAAVAAAFPQGIRCQKCLGYGHWSYECKSKRKHLVRPSRTQILKQNMKKKEDGECSGGSCKVPKKNKKLTKDGTIYSSESGQDADKSSSSNSSSSDSSDSSDSDSQSDSESESSRSDSSFSSDSSIF